MSERQANIHCFRKPQAAKISSIEPITIANAFKTFTMRHSVQDDVVAGALGYLCTFLMDPVAGYLDSQGWMYMCWMCLNEGNL